MKGFSPGDTETNTRKAGEVSPWDDVAKVEISGVNSAKLPVLSREEAKELFLQARAGSQEAREN